METITGGEDKKAMISNALGEGRGGWESAENALPCLADLFAPRSRDHIPTPPRATTKLFDATCVPTAPVTWRNAGAV